jgi:hypothetical protein
VRAEVQCGQCIALIAMVEKQAELVFINGLVMAKVMRIAQGLHFGKWFNKSSLLYATLF